MKRYGYLIERVIELENLSGAFDRVMRGKRKNKTYRYFVSNKDRILRELAYEIENDLYTPKGYNEFGLVEYDKLRTIQSLSFRDRIALHAIMSIVSETLGGMLIRDTYASLPGRGIHDGFSRVRKALRNHEGTRYCLKLDLRKFYHSVDQDVLLALLARKIKDRRMMNTLTRIVRTFSPGLPIGFHSSQFLGNFYLWPLDHYVKIELGVKYYFRYCDDIVVLSSDKEELWRIFRGVKDFVETKLHLSVKDNYQVFPVEARGIDFLGYVIRHHYVRLRKKIKKTAAWRLKKVKSRKRRTAIRGAFWGWVKHCDSKHLIKKLFSMKDFKELGIKYEPKDGKKRFSGELARLSDLQNCEIIVHDFERDIPTRYSKEEGGGGRYVVQIEYNNERKKFITNSDEMKNILEQVAAAGALPFKTTIKRESFGQNKAKYVFT